MPNQDLLRTRKPVRGDIELSTSYRELDVALQLEIEEATFLRNYYDHSDFPEYLTLCNFRNDLLKARMLEAIFGEIMAQLEA